jgi:GntR family transcriptional regulator
MALRGKFSTEPLYVQVRNLLAQRIASGVWAPGAMLPNEIDLARELHVSSGTVRKALDILEGERLVIRRQGRGTSVVDQALGDVAARFSNIRDAAGRRIVGDMELLTQAEAPASETERRRLQLEAGDPVLRTTRLRRYRNQPFMYEEVTLATSRLPGLDAGGAGNFRISALAQRHGIHLAKASELLTMEEATPEIAQRFEIDARARLLKLDRVIYTAGGNPVEWRVALCSLKDDLLYLAEMD